MMDWTDSSCRVLHRCLTRHALLYTEMVTADAVLHGDRVRLLGFDALEHPLALQLGGSDPGKLAEAAKIAADFGYDEVNLNVGCPSDRVRSGRFGACLMREPGLVAANASPRCESAVTIPVTIKCRIGVDEQEPEAVAAYLDRRLSSAGVTLFAVHARKAWLQGLSPKENRDMPPLDYDLVYRVKRERPALTILVNGGVENLEQAEEHLRHVDGVMLGRAAYQKRHPAGGGRCPFLWRRARGVDAAVDTYADHVARQLAAGQRLHPLIKPMLGLYNGRPGVRLFRRHLSEHAHVTAPASRCCAMHSALCASAARPKGCL